MTDRVFQRDGLGSVQPPHAARPGGQVTAGPGGGGPGCWVRRGGGGRLTGPAAGAQERPRVLPHSAPRTLCA